MAKRKNSAGKKRSTGLGGLLVLIIFVAVFGNSGQQSASSASSPQKVQPAGNADVAGRANDGVSTSGQNLLVAQVNATATVTPSALEATLDPIHADAIASLMAVDGVLDVPLITILDTAIYIEAVVEPEMVSVETARAMRDAVRFTPGVTLTEFGAILDDGVEAVDFVWSRRNGEDWIETPLGMTGVLPPTLTAIALRPTATPTTVASIEEYTATGNANVRSCPQTTCEIVDGVVLGQRLQKVGEVQGASVNGSSVWYEILLDDGTTGFVHSGLVRSGTPRPAPAVVQPRATTAPNQAVATSAGNTLPEAPAVLPTIPQSTAAPSSQYTCGGDFYNCSDFGNRNELMAYFNTCPGDPSRLDSDNDGIPCESLR